MNIVVAKDYDEMSKIAADIIAAQVKAKLDSVLGLATGSTPVGTYKQLVEMHNAGLDFSHISSVNLDEYVGLPETDAQSYRYFMNENLFDHVNVDKRCTFVPNGMNADAEKECADYEAKIDVLGGIDLQLLGVGVNGHIGFNEPCEFFPDKTHIVDLTQSTIDANKRFFEREEDVPRRAYTMGVGTIMRARRVLVVISGENKADIVKEFIHGNVSPKVPISILRFHPDAIIVMDKAAAKYL